MMADIQQIFHQVLDIPEDRGTLRFIWQDIEKEKFLE